MTLAPPPLNRHATLNTHGDREKLKLMSQTLEKFLAANPPKAQLKYRARCLQGGQLLLPEAVHQKLALLECFAYAIYGSRNQYQVVDRSGRCRTVLTLTLVSGDRMLVSSPDAAIHAIANKASDRRLAR